MASQINVMLSKDVVEHSADFWGRAREMRSGHVPLAAGSEIPRSYLTNLSELGLVLFGRR